MAGMKKLEAGKLIFLDESGVNTGMTRRYGRAVGKQRCEDAAPRNHGKNITLLSAIRLDGSIITTTMHGAMHGCDFLDFIQSKLVPSVHEGDVVIMDNLKTHKVDGVEDAIKSAKASVLYLPPYSPDLNPIEEMWSKIKAYLRKVKARLSDTLISAINDAFASVTATDMSGWFTHAGYIYGIT
jgi:transposase